MFLFNMSGLVSSYCRFKDYLFNPLLGAVLMKEALRFESVTKKYDEFTALDNVSLDIQSGEFMTLLGPSGSGKTTMLMTIGGFVEPTAGRVTVDGREITHLPPENRNFGLVFQGYALFPHLTVWENVFYPLRVRGMSKSAAASKVSDVLDLIQLSQLSERYPKQLSGGQQQRVALARALVFSPELLLLDEPLSDIARWANRTIGDAFRII